MTNLAMKPGSGKPVPRVHQVQGKAAPLPMHMVRPVVETIRNPKGSIPFTLAMLRDRECTHEQLAEAHAGRYPGEGIDTGRMVRHLVRHGHVVQDDQGLIGLTAAGEKELIAIEAAARLPPARSVRNVRAFSPPAAPIASPVPAPTTTSKSRPSSEADNRNPPTRAGADDALQLPSRIGDKLHYRSGLITDLAGTVLQPARGDDVNYRPTHAGQDRARPVFASNH